MVDVTTQGSAEPASVVLAADPAVLEPAGTEVLGRAPELAPRLFHEELEATLELFANFSSSGLSARSRRYPGVRADARSSAGRPWPPQPSGAERKIAPPRFV